MCSKGQTCDRVSSRQLPAAARPSALGHVKHLAEAYPNDPRQGALNMEVENRRRPTNAKLIALVLVCGAFVGALVCAAWAYQQLRGEQRTGGAPSVTSLPAGRRVLEGLDVSGALLYALHRNPWRTQMAVSGKTDSAALARFCVRRDLAQGIVGEKLDLSHRVAQLGGEPGAYTVHFCAEDVRVRFVSAHDDVTLYFRKSDGRFLAMMNLATRDRE
jgi:hypothetical protein